MILNTAEKDKAVINGTYQCLFIFYYCDADLYTVAYLFTIVDYVANTEVATQQANAADCSPQYTPTCLESSDCSRSSW